MTDDVSTQFREKVAKQRPPFEADLMLRAVVVARAKHDAMAAEDIEGKTVADLTDEQALVNGFALFLEDWRGFVEMPALNRCGWCAEANGEDWDALPRMTLAEIREHTVACQHNPLVVENERLKQLEWQTGMVHVTSFSAKSAECDVLRAELAELRARDGYKVTSALEFDWPLVGEAARRITKIVNDIGFTAPEALDLHQIRATEVCQAIDAIVAALKLQRLEDVRTLRAELARWEAIGEKRDIKLREPGCKCDREAGDSPCPVHTWALCKEPPTEIGETGCRWIGKMSDLDDRDGIKHCPNCGSTAIIEDLVEEPSND